MTAPSFRGMDGRRGDDLAWDRVKLSVVIPAYNEIGSAEKLLRRVREVRLDVEVIVVDDGSTDGTRDLLVRLRDEGVIDVLVFQEVNQGKGAALRAGFERVRVRSTRDTGPHATDFGRQGRRSVRVALSGRTSPRAFFLAHDGESFPYAAEQHVHGPQPHGHGDLL